jgi:hypothetical protein
MTSMGNKGDVSTPISCGRGFHCRTRYASSPQVGGKHDSIASPVHLLKIPDKVLAYACIVFEVIVPSVHDRTRFGIS